MLPILDILKPVFDKVLSFIPDPVKKAEAQAAMTAEFDRHQETILAALTVVDKAQNDVNAEEAKSPSLFIAGWRPFLGWTLASAFGWAYVVQPLAVFVLNAAGHPMALPTLDLSQMSSVLMGMLGLAGLRTYEKVQGAQNNH